MDKTENPKDPADQGDNSAFRNQLPIIAAVATDAAEQTTGTRERKNDSKDKPGPVRLAWYFVKDPSHSGAVMAIFTVLLFLVNAGYMVISGLTLKNMGQQLTVMKQSTQAARDAAEIALAANRPLLRLKLSVGHFTVEQDGSIRVNVVPQVQNTGNALPIATDLAVFADVPSMSVMDTNEYGADSPEEIANRLRERCRKTPTSERSMIPLTVIFPNSPPADLRPDGEEIAIDLIKARGKSIEGRFQFVVMVYGCITYSYPDRSTFHRTGIAYQLHTVGYHPLKSMTEYTATDLQLEPWGFHSDFAD